MTTQTTQTTEAAQAGEVVYRTGDAILVHFHTITSPAIVAGVTRRKAGPWLYVVGKHFGMNIGPEQQVGSPIFDSTFPVRCELVAVSPEHEAIAENVRIRLRRRDGANSTIDGR